MRAVGVRIGDVDNRDKRRRRRRSYAKIEAFLLPENFFPEKQLRTNKINVI